MRPEQKTKSRQKLYAALEGGKEIVGEAGASATGSIQFADVAVDGEYVTIGGVYFEFDSTGEVAGTSAGTVDDPHLVDQGVSVITTAANLAAAVLAETETTGRWGFLHPIDALGASGDGVDTLDLTFYPGTAGNTVQLTGSVGDETIVLPETAALGVTAPVISPDVNVNVIDTTGASNNQEYYTLADGKLGQTAKVLVKTFAASTTPSILGHLKEDGVAMVECEFITGEPGAYVEFAWDGEAWSQTGTSALNTQPDFSPSA